MHNTNHVVIWFFRVAPKVTPHSWCFFDAPLESYAEIMCLQLNTLVTQFEANQKAAPFMSCSNQDMDFHAMQSIVDWQNIAFNSSFNLDNPLAFTTSAKNNPDILSQGQMLKGTNHKKFIASQLPEIQGLVDADVFEFCSMSDLPPRACLLNAIWSHCCKCHPDGYLLKHKSRICTDGSQQQYDIDYWETYTPIVHWSTIWMVLVLSALLWLKSCQVNYTQAFPQAPLDGDDFFMKLWACLSLAISW